MFAEIMAVLIFLTMFILIIMDKFRKELVTLSCGLLTLVLVFAIGMHSIDAIKETIALSDIIRPDFWYAVPGSGEGESTTGINWATIIFLCGMMIMVEGMAEAQFFDWLCIKIAKLAKFEPLKIFVSFMILSGVLAMFIDSITVILFLAAVTVQLAKTLKFNPIPVILAEVFCANLGGSATMCGDPPNIIIGTALSKSFTDFLVNTGVIAFISFIVIVFFFYFTMKKDIVNSSGKVNIDELDLEVKIEDKKEFFINIAIFLLAVVLLVSHASTGLSVAFIGTFIAILTLVFSGHKALKLLKRVDWATLAFFIGLFVVVGGLEETGILVTIAEFIENVSGGNVRIMLAIILFVSAIASAFIDNIPFAATMVPVIQTLAVTMNVPLDTLAWTLAIGTDIGGSATPIGASANVVGVATASKEGYPIGWGTYCKYMAPATIIVLVISIICIYVRYL